MNPTFTTPEQVLKRILKKTHDPKADLRIQISTLATTFGFRNVIRAADLKKSSEGGIKKALKITPEAMSQGMFLCLLIMLEIALLNERKKFSHTFSIAAERLPGLFTSFANKSDPNAAEVLMYQHVLEQLQGRS